ncbi:hypothetical protein [Dankookia sp. P2]|uniref:hypothetical protein n=1 Tax=Dankookia sp. P2 TaxID=3423955 RepID=UPI003D664B51
MDAAAVQHQRRRPRALHAEPDGTEEAVLDPHQPDPCRGRAPRQVGRHHRRPYRGIAARPPRQPQGGRAAQDDARRPGLAGQRRPHDAMLEPFHAGAGDDPAVRRLGQPPALELGDALRRGPGPVAEGIGPTGRGQQRGEGGLRRRAAPGGGAAEPRRDAGRAGQQRHARRERVQLGRQVEQRPGREAPRQHGRARRRQHRRGAGRRIRVERHQHGPARQRRQHGARGGGLA